MASGLREHSDSDFSDEDQSSLDISFSKAADNLRRITNKLTDDQLLEMYALYKQGTEGKCYTQKPGWFDQRGRKKWDAWSGLGNMSIDDAKKRYIELVQQFDPDTESPSSQQGPKEMWVAVSSLRHSPEPELDHENLSILDAAKEDLGDLVAALLSKIPELKNEKDDDGLTALHWAADRDATSALTAALRGGCYIDAVDQSGQTALHYAVSCSHVESTKILVEAGASLLKDEEGNTPLELATDEQILSILGRIKN